MKINHIDHLFLTTKDLSKCLHFYVDILGMKHECHNNRHSFLFNNEKINIHTRKAEFLPAAENRPMEVWTYVSSLTEISLKQRKRLKKKVILLNSDLSQDMVHLVK